MNHIISRNIFRNFTDVLKHELVPAIGCTEPIAIAFTASKAREILGCTPERIQVICSGNIIKNAKSVTVPNTNGMKGIDVSAVIGAVRGNSSLGYEILKNVTEDNINEVKSLLEAGICEVSVMHTEAVLNIIVRMTAADNIVEVEVKNEHLHVVRIEKNGEVLLNEIASSGDMSEIAIMPSADIDDIYEYANTVDLEEVRSIVENQLNKNLAIAEEGLRHRYGANVGKNILNDPSDSCLKKAMAYAAAGSDARMNGCSLPVVINSGSGNQGLTVSLPVYVYAKKHHVSDERMLRALIFSNLTAIYLNSKIGRLSAYCGVVNAATGSGAAITYMLGGSIKQIEGTIINSLGTLSGMVCDGAKSSCAAKIATAVNCAIMSRTMAMHGNTFLPGEGLVRNTLEKTVDAYTTMGRVGMRETDRIVLNLMTEKCHS